MTTKILCVDDDHSLLVAHQRILQRHFEVETAASGELGLEAIRNFGPYAVILSDMRMPGMDGSAFLKLAMELAPDSVRIMLTGNNDQETAVRAVNEGHVFRLVHKPCDSESLIQTVRLALKQYQLITAERELLEQTLNGSVKLLTDILSMADPAAFGKAKLLRDYVHDYLDVNVQAHPDRWEIELAAMLLNLGHVTIPQGLLEKDSTGSPLSETELDMLKHVPETGFGLLSNIPRLHNVAQIVRFQNKHYDGSGLPHESVKGQEIPYGARLLKILKDLIEREASGLSRDQAASALRARTGTYDRQILEDCAARLKSQPSPEQQAEQVATILIKQLTNKHVLVSPLVTNEGMVIAPGGTEVSNLILQKIRNFGTLHVLREPIQVRMRSLAPSRTQKLVSR